VLVACGRPHEFRSLLRQARLPAFLAGLSLFGGGGDSRGTGFGMRAYRVVPDAVDGLVAAVNGPSPERLGSFPAFEAGPGSLLACGAGLTLATSPAGRPYLFGLNTFGQCGSGRESSNAWEPGPLLGVAGRGEEHAEIFAADARLGSATMPQ
jgi:hypothetical protein